MEPVPGAKDMERLMKGPETESGNAVGRYHKVLRVLLNSARVCLMSSLHRMANARYKVHEAYGGMVLPGKGMRQAL